MPFYKTESFPLRTEKAYNVWNHATLPHRIVDFYTHGKQIYLIILIIRYVQIIITDLYHYFDRLMCEYVSDKSYAKEAKGRKD